MPQGPIPQPRLLQGSHLPAKVDSYENQALAASQPLHCCCQHTSRGAHRSARVLLLLLPRHAAAVQLRHCCIAVASAAVETLAVLACRHPCGC
jgi:hypothetical protein